MGWTILPVGCWNYRVHAFSIPCKLSFTQKEQPSRASKKQERQVNCFAFFERETYIFAFFFCLVLFSSSIDISLQKNKKTLKHKHHKSTSEPKKKKKGVLTKIYLKMSFMQRAGQSVQHSLTSSTRNAGRGKHTKWENISLHQVHFMSFNQSVTALSAKGWWRYRVQNQCFMCKIQTIQQTVELSLPFLSVRSNPWKTHNPSYQHMQILSLDFYSFAWTFSLHHPCQSHTHTHTHTHTGHPALSLTTSSLLWLGFHGSQNQHHAPNSLQSQTAIWQMISAYPNASAGIIPVQLSAQPSPVKHKQVQTAVHRCISPHHDPVQQPLVSSLPPFFRAMETGQLGPLQELVEDVDVAGGHVGVRVRFVDETLTHVVIQGGR